MNNHYLDFLIIVIIAIGSGFISNIPFGETQPSVIVSNPIVSGVYTNPANVEYLTTNNSSSPIILLLGGFRTDYTEYATFQLDLVNQGYVTVSVSESHVVNISDLTTTKQNLPTDVSFDHQDIIALLNWIGNSSLGIGNKQNIILIARSTSGCASLIYDYSSYGVKGVCALSPAFNFTSAAKNSYPVFIINAQGDTTYQPNGKQYYSEVVAPKAYIEFRNGAHNLGIINNGEEILPNIFTSITEKYVFAFLNYATLNSQIGYNTINSAIIDSNVLVSENLFTNPVSAVLPTINASSSATAMPTISTYPLIIVTIVLVAVSLTLLIKYRKIAKAKGHLLESFK